MPDSIFLSLGQDNLLIFIFNILREFVALLRCNDYGFECPFVSEGDIEHVIEEFGKHTEEEHGIDYSREALMQFIMRKQN